MNEIVINVNDENPRPNTALVDSGLSVATYNKEQINERIINGYSGTMSNSLPIPLTGYYRYKVISPGTYTNVTPNISVSPKDIKYNIVVISVNDGIATKELDPKLDDRRSFKALFSYKKLQKDNVFEVGVSSSNEINGLRVQLSNAGAPFSNLLVAKNGSSNFHFVLSERSYQKIVFKQNQLYGGQEYSDMGIGVAFISSNSYGYNWHAQAYLITKSGSPDFGKITITGKKSSGNISITSSERLEYNIGDIIEFIFEREYTDYIITAKNLSKGSQVSFRVMSGENDSNYIPFNTSNPCVYIASGDFTVFSYEYGYTTSFCENMYVGDSITQGAGSIVEPLRWASKSGIKSNNIISGGGADYTKSVVDRLYEIIYVNPDRVFLMIGGNDILFGVPASDWQYRLDYIAETLISNGIELVMCYPSARAGAGQLINYINTSNVLKNLPFVDCNTPTAVSGTTDQLRHEYDSGDALHPNPAGHEAIASAINQWLAINAI